MSNIVQRSFLDLDQIDNLRTPDRDAFRKGRASLYNEQDISEYSVKGTLLTKSFIIINKSGQVVVSANGDENLTLFLAECLNAWGNRPWNGERLDIEIAGS